MVGFIYLNPLFVLTPWSRVPVAYFPQLQRKLLTFQIMDDISSIFPWLQYNSDYQILICRRCQGGIRNSSLTTHIREYYKDIDLSQRR